jgi:hypothetical protein
MKPGSLSLLEPSGLVQACTGIALPFTKICQKSKVYYLEITTIFAKNIAVHSHYVSICVERFQLRLKPHITASLASPSQANRRPRVGFW